ncbi:MAG: chemotaxis protein CheW [Bryobacteraceae bacterium]
MDLSEDRELLQEFLVETANNLEQLDLDLVGLEKAPEDPALLNRIFRTIHTVKGTCGFLGLMAMERISHNGENVLNRLRAGELRLNHVLASLILEMVDALKREAASLEATFAETGETYEALVKRLEAASEAPAGEYEAPQRPTEPAPQAPVVATLAQLDRVQVAEPAVSVAKPVPEAPPENKPQEPRAAAESKAADSTIRLDVSLADRMVNLVGELVLVRNQMIEAGERDAAAASQARHRLNLITSELQESVMKTRMQPVGAVWNKLPRIVRDLGAQLGKQINLVMEGAETEMDRSIIEAIRDPLTHIVRNSCDHGIEGPELRRQRGKSEQGTLNLRAYHESGQVVIEVTDDGGGIHVERVGAKAIEKGLVTKAQLDAMSERQMQELIFLPGFSTAEKVSNISGRGVGMDVVRSNIQSIGGTFELSSKYTQGTRLRIRIPLTLAIIPGLLVWSGGHRFVIPQASLLDLVRVEGAQAESAVQWVDDNPVFRRGGKLWPLVLVNNALGLHSLARAGVLTIVFVQAEGRRFGLVVDSIQSTREIVVKPLGRMAKRLGTYAGATILDDGSVALIVDVPGLARRAGLPEVAEEPPRHEAATASDDRQTLLLLEAGSWRNAAIPLERVGRLERFARSSVETSAGRAVVQYRGAILPLIGLGAVLDGSLDRLPDSAEIPTVVVHAGGATAGLMVDRIRDIRAARLEAKRPPTHPGLRCTAVFDGKVCDVIDLDRILAASAAFGEGQCS